MDFSTADGADVGDKWWKWRQTMDLTIRMSGKTEEVMCGVLLYITGQATCDIYNMMTFSEEPK